MAKYSYLITDKYGKEKKGVIEAGSQDKLNNKLEAIISMPSGVFKPYAGVSTAILIFTKTNTGGTDKVWFYDMTADGLSLDDKRTPVAENDISDIITRFHNLKGEKERKRTEDRAEKGILGRNRQTHP